MMLSNIRIIFILHALVKLLFVQNLLIIFFRVQNVNVEMVRPYIYIFNLIGQTLLLNELIQFLLDHLNLRLDFSLRGTSFKYVMRVFSWIFFNAAKGFSFLKLLLQVHDFIFVYFLYHFVFLLFLREKMLLFLEELVRWDNVVAVESRMLIDELILLWVLIL
jgi:hypothetical protein